MTGWSSATENGAVLPLPGVDYSRHGVHSRHPFACRECESLADVGRDLVDTLYYGDNLEILSRFISDETVDLIYLDPPFNKNKAYSLIFRDESGRTSDAQLATFEDYWHWGPTPARHYEYLTNSAEHGGRVPHGVSDLVGALHSAIRPSPMLAYIVEMTSRMVELRRVLKPTGSLYLHCDPTASHYLRLILDALFGPEHFLSEIVWRRTTTHSDAKKWSPDADRILVYAKSPRFTFHPQFGAHDARYVRENYRHKEPDGRIYRLDNIASPNERPNLMYEWRGHQPPAKGWRFARDTMERLDAEGRIWYPDSTAKRPKVKRYLAEMPGSRIGEVWTDLQNVHPWSKERRPYPTQKPVTLLRRIIEASSNPGDLVLDPFCGCGTTIEAVYPRGSTEPDRQWIGIDNSDLAVRVIRARMRARGIEVPVFDWPTEMAGVERMVEAPGGRYRFEDWALNRLGLPENRRGGDGGRDGRIAFTTPTGRVESIIVSVKSGHIGPSVLRDLRGTMQDAKAVMGLLFTFKEPTEAMRREAASAGFYRAPDGHQYPRLVIYTVRELFDGHRPELPSHHGVQQAVWSLPTASRPVRLRPVRQAAISPRAAAPANAESQFASHVRERYAAASTAEEGTLSPDVEGSTPTEAHEPEHAGREGDTDS